MGLFFYIINQIDKEKVAKDVLTQLFAFIYSIAHYIGLGMVRLILYILPMLKEKELETLADPIGFLAMLTVFIIIVSVARKIAWIIVVVGWIMILIRIILMIIGIV